MQISKMGKKLMQMSRSHRIQTGREGADFLDLVGICRGFSYIYYNGFDNI